MDFVHDQLARVPKLRILTMVDTFSQFLPTVVPRLRFRAPDVVEVLERGCRDVGYLALICVEQSSEFISRKLNLCAYIRGTMRDFSRPGTPTANAFIESLNSLPRRRLAARSGRSV